MSEVREMEHAEFVLWSRYYARKAQQQQLADGMAGQ